MRILIAPDSFKGTLTAEEVACHLAGGLKSTSPAIEPVTFPLADGGDGTQDALRFALGGTNLPQEYRDTGLWLPGVAYQMTIIKSDREIAMKVEGPDRTSHFYFKNDELPPVTHGRIGLRHMYTRSARYKNFRVSERGD